VTPTTASPAAPDAGALQVHHERQRRGLVANRLVGRLVAGVCRLDDGQATVADPADQVEHLLGLDDTQRRRRLVEQDHVLGPHRGPRDGHRLALTAGEGGDRNPQVLHHPDPELGEALRRLPTHRRLVVQDLEPADLATEEDVRSGIQVWRQRQVLG
jgi:hypothetical protein